jgi:hypothetical protein
MLNFLTDYARDVRKPNRCKRAPAFVSKPPDVFHHEDNTISIAYMTIGEATRIYHLSARSPHLYGMRRRLGEVMGYTEEDYQA